MAEKEERIGITKFKETETPDFELCAYHLITRTEAIERIIKGIENSGEVNCYDEIQWIGGWKEVIAEAALNALLGKGND